MKKVLFLAILIITVSVLFAGTPRNVIQKVVCQDQDILSIVTNTGTTHNADYRIRVWMTERPSEILDTAPPISTIPGNLRLAKVGNGASTPYYAAITLQIGAFATQWSVGNHLHYEVTYLPTSQSASWELTLPSGTSSIIITDPAQVVPPMPVYDYPQGQIVSFTGAPAGNSILFNQGNGNATTGTPSSSVNTSFTSGLTQFISLAETGPWDFTINSTYQWIWVVGYGAFTGPSATYNIPTGSDSVIEIQCGDGGNPTIPIVINSLVVESNPSGFEIYKNGINTGFTTPHTFTPGEAGSYSLAPRVGYNWEPLEYEVPVLSTDITISFDSHWINVNPGVAQNPSPSDGTIFHINEGNDPISYTLSWQAPAGDAPTGYKIAWNGMAAVDLGNVNSWITPLLGPGENTWQIVPYINAPASRSRRELQTIDDVDISLGTGKISRGDAENCPIWTFTITTEPDYEIIERAALTQIYNAAEGGNWTNSTNWLSNEPLNTWYGVTVTNGRVTQLDLENNNLQGTISSAIGNLTSLRGLNLNHNQLSGTIPSEMGSLLHLTYLDLSSNQFNGTIPASINSLSSLQYLMVSNNNLDALPPMSGLSSLLVLSLENNRFIFDDLEPIINLPSQTCTYSPQANVLDSLVVNVVEDLDYTMDSVIAGTQNSYRWFKDGTLIGNQGLLVLTDLQSTDSGSYTCSITSSLVPGLTLTRNPIILTVVPTNDPPVINLPPSVAIAQNESLILDLSPYISDPDGDDLVITSTGSLHISVRIQGLSVTMTPMVNWIGNELVSFTVSDGVIDSRITNHGRAMVSDDINVIVSNPLTIDFSASNAYNNNLVAEDPLTAVTFTATSNLAITSWAWDFDNDGTVDSTLPEPSYFYPTPGLKSVSLQISDGVHVNWLTKENYLEVLPGVVVPPAELSQNLVWTEQGGPYNLIGELLLNPGYSLTIEPNAQVNLLVDSLLVINGSINASGAYFSSYGAAGWEGVVLGPTSTNSVINSITINGASTGITMNNCSPVLSNISMQGSSLTRTPSRALVLNSASPTLSNIMISNFDCGLVASNPGNDAINLNLESLHFERGVNNPASTDTGIEVSGNYIVEIDNAHLSNYNIGIKIDGSINTRGRARLTNTRVIKTESTNRDNSIGYWLTHLTNAYVQGDSIRGFNTGILIDSGATTITSVDVSNCLISRQGNIMGSEKGIHLLGSSLGRIDSLLVANYATGIDNQGQHQLHIGSNRFINCRTTYNSDANQAVVDFARNLAWRNAQFNGAINHPAIACVSGSGLNVLSNTFYGFPNWINANNSSMTVKQNIAWSNNPDPNTISLTGTSTVNATYNDIALSQGVYPGVGNINSNPLFTNSTLGDFSLNVYSPCIDAGDPSSPNDPDGSRADMGAYTFNWATAPLIADFNVDSSSGQHPLVVHFTDHSTRNAISREWDFNGDNITDSTEQNPVWTYASTGTYSVILRVFDGVRYAVKQIPDLIHALNTAPQISQVIPPLNIPEDSPNTTIELANYFHDANNDPLSFSFTQSNQVVSASINGSQLVIGTNPNIFGTCEFTVTALEALRAADLMVTKQIVRSESCREQSRISQSFTVTVTPVNDAPVITLPASFTFAEDGNLSINMAEYASDVDNPSLTLTATGNTHVTVSISGMTVTLGAEANWSGTEAITFTVNDNVSRDGFTSMNAGNLFTRLSASATTNIIVSSVNEAPTIALPASYTFAEDGNLVIDMASLVSDVDSPNLTLSAQNSPHVFVAFNGLVATLTSVSDWSGTDNLTFTVSDGSLTAEATTSIVVIPVNDAPTINLMPSYQFAEDGTLELDLSDDIDDIDSPNLSLSVSGNQFIHCAIQGNMLIFSADSNWFGSEEITVTVSDDATRLSDSATTQISVLPLNDAPEITSYTPVDAQIQVECGTSVAFSVEAQDPDSEISYQWYYDDQPQNCTLPSYSHLFEAGGAHILKVQVSDDSCHIDHTWQIQVSVDNDDQVQAPVVQGIVSIYPNPFSSQTSIAYGVSKEQPTKIIIYNAKGQVVRNLISGYSPSGYHSVTWDAKDNAGRVLPSGIYFVKYQSNSATSVKRMVLSK